MTPPDFDKLAEEFTSANLWAPYNQMKRYAKEYFERVFEQGVEMGVEAEREACAKECERHISRVGDHFHDGVAEGAKACAWDIRARGNR